MFVARGICGGRDDYAAYLACVREISAAAPRPGSSGDQFPRREALIDFGSEEQKRRLLARVAEGALCALAITEPRPLRRDDMTTRFTPEGDGIRIDGGKIFITNGDVARLICCSASGAISRRRGSAITALYPRQRTAPGFRRGLRKEDKLGHRRSVDRGARLLTAAFVAARQSARRAGPRLPCCSPRSTSRGRRSPRTRSASPRAAFWRRRRPTSNQRRQSGRRIVDSKASSSCVADLATDLAMCEAWLWHVAALVDAEATISGPRRRC